MRHLTVTVTFSICLAVSPSGPLWAQTADRAAPWDRDFKPPRNAWGHPDLQGNWSNATLTPFQRRAGDGPTYTWDEVAALEEWDGDCPPNPGTVACGRQAGTGSDLARLSGQEYPEVYWERGTTVAVVDGEPRTSMITFPASGRIPPLTPEGQRRQDEHRAMRSRFGSYDHPELRPMQERCLIYGSSFGAGSPSQLGPPIVPNGGYNHNYTIVQNADHVMIMTEKIHDYRIIRLGEPRRLPDHVRPYFGDSWGRWAGDTLVVETTGISPMQRYRIHSDQLRVLERFTRVDDDTILYTFEVRDPLTYVEPWGGEIPMERFDDHVYEYACHEGNYGFEGVLRGARYEEAQAAGREPSAR